MLNALVEFVLAVFALGKRAVKWVAAAGTAVVQATVEWSSLSVLSAVVGMIVFGRYLLWASLNLGISGCHVTRCLALPVAAVACGGVFAVRFTPAFVWAMLRHTPLFAYAVLAVLAFVALHFAAGIAYLVVFLDRLIKFLHAVKQMVLDPWGDEWGRLQPLWKVSAVFDWLVGWLALLRDRLGG